MPSSVDAEAPAAMRRYRIGLLVDRLEVPQWVSALADWATDHPAIELAAVIVSPREGAGIFDKLFRLESRLLLRNPAYRSYARLYPFGGRAPVELHGHLGSLARDRFELDPEDLSTLTALRLDALVACGQAMPGAALLKAAKDGMVSISVGGALQANPGAAGFLEVLEGRPETPFTIEKLQGVDEPPQILFSGSVATGLFFGSNLISVYARAFPYLQLSLERLAEGNAPRIVPAADPSARPLGVADLLTYGGRTAGRSIGKAVRRFSGKEFNWQVAFRRQPWSSHGWSEGRVVPNPPGAFLADPFTIKVDGGHYLFVEEYPFATRKGVISAYRLEGDEFHRIGVVLEEPYHLSFPFVFRHEGEIYMMPESGADRSIKIYRSSNFPCGWSEAKVLLEDVPAVDSMLFKQGSLWWLLTTIQGKGPGLNNAELHAFHASDPFGDWTPHRKNPVVMDARKGRNGGFLRDEYGNPCRVAQVPGFTFYGAGSAIYRIDEISPDTYRESPVQEVRPTFFPNLDGTHHIHSADGLTVYDFMRVERPREGRGGGRDNQQLRTGRAA